VRKSISSSEIREQRVRAHSASRRFDRPRRIRDTRDNNGLRADRRLIPEKVLQEIRGREPVSTIDAAVRMSAAAANATT